MGPFAGAVAVAARVRTQGRSESCTVQHLYSLCSCAVLCCAVRAEFRFLHPPFSLSGPGDVGALQVREQKRNGVRHLMVNQRAPEEVTVPQVLVIDRKK